MDHGGCSERLERLMFSICNATPALSGEECDGILIEWALRANQGGTADDASVLILGQVFLFFPQQNKKSEVLSMKKISVLLILVLILTTMSLSLFGCNNASSQDDALQVGIIQLLDNGAFEDMREGFIAQMRSHGYSETQLDFDYRNAQGDMSNLNAICQEMVNSQKDLIVTIATPPTQAFVNMESDIPVIFISVSNPVGAGIMTDLNFPDKNATGTSNAIPIDEMFKLSQRLTPGMETYGLLYNTSEINSVTTINQAKEYMDTNGLSYEEAVVTNSSEVQQAAQSLVGRVDALFIPNDSMIQSAMPQVSEIAKEAKIPVYGSSAVMVASGAFATISISDTEIGQLSADMAHQHLQGTPIEQIPAVVVSSFTTVINQTTADALGIELTEDILTNAVFLD